MSFDVVSPLSVISRRPLRSVRSVLTGAAGVGRPVQQRIAVPRAMSFAGAGQDHGAYGTSVQAAGRCASRVDSKQGL